MLSAMVKTLGSSTQALRMRSACARCISNTVHSLIKVEQELLEQQQQLEQQQEEDGDDGSRTPRSDAAAGQQQGAPRAGAAVPTAASPPVVAGSVGRSPSPLRPDLAAAGTGTAAGTGASPSPSASPRSAPMAASFDELCAEPKLLDNLLLCLSPEKCVDVARKARAEAAAPGLGPGAAEEAEELARNAVRAVSVILLVSHYWVMHCCVVCGYGVCVCVCGAAFKRGGV